MLFSDGALTKVTLFGNYTLTEDKIYALNQGEELFRMIKDQEPRFQSEAL